MDISIESTDALENGKFVIEFRARVRPDDSTAFLRALSYAIGSSDEPAAKTIAAEVAAQSVDDKPSVRTILEERLAAAQRNMNALDRVNETLRHDLDEVLARLAEVAGERDSLRAENQTLRAKLGAPR